MRWIVKVLFFVFLGLGIFYLSKGCAYDCMLSDSNKAHYEQLIEYHEIKGARYLAKAEKECRFLPNLTDRDKAKYCFTSAMSMAAPGTPMAKVVTMILVALTQYGIDCLDHMDKIDEYLLESRYHYDMADFYRHVLRKG